MTHVAYFGFPARSHTVPSLALARECVRRGARVDYHSTERFRPMIEATGARFLRYASVTDALADPDGLSGPGSVVAHAHRIAAATERALPEIARTAGRPDLVLFDASARWGGLFARLAGIPCAAFTTTFASNRSMLRLLGIADGTALDVLVPAAERNIVCTSRYFQPSGPFFDEPRYLFIGPLAGERAREGGRIAVQGQRPLAYVSLGTIFNRDLALLRRIAAALSGAGWQVAVALGAEAGTGAAAQAWPPHVTAYPFVDQLDALAKADLAVTHGGLASVSEIAAHRLPCLVAPQAVDQFLVAKRAADLGAAIVVDDPASPDAWRAAIGRVQAGRAPMIAAAGRIADSFHDVRPVGEVAGQLLPRCGAA